MYQRGDQVIEQGTVGAVGSVLSGPEVHGGESYYRVNFNGRVPDSLLFTDGRKTGSMRRAALDRIGSLLLLAYGLAYPRPEIPKFERDVEGVQTRGVEIPHFTPEEMFGHN